MASNNAKGKGKVTDEKK
jgi:hypothetical protein